MIKIKRAKNGQFYFTVHARNGKILATSETYTTRSKAKKGSMTLRYVFVGSAANDIVDETAKPVKKK